MKIALAQLEVIPANPDKNVKNMLELIEKAKTKKADIIVFPEMCIGGYLLGDKWLSEDYCIDLMSYNETIKEASKGITVIYGNIYVDKKEDIQKRANSDSIHPNKDGRVRKYNAIYAFCDQNPVERKIKNKIIPEGIDIKTLHPNYRIFDDERYFFSLQDVSKDFNVKLKELCSPFLINVENKEIPIGFEVCEDLWCEDYRYDEKAINKTKILIDNGAKFIINISASPWTYGKNAARDRRVLFLKKESGKDFVPFFYVNCTGVQNNGKNIVTFDGGSTVYNKEGIPIVFSKTAYQQELMIIDEKDLNKQGQARKEEPKIKQKYDAVIRGMQSIKDMIGLPYHPKIVIGLSGGIDSSIVASLLVKAIGKENIIGINLPTKYNSQKTKDAAKSLADQLGILYSIVPIESIVNENISLLDKADLDKSGKKLSTLNIENIQAKIRGTSVLSNLAAKYGAMFTNNGNKDEVFLGYATLYGDVGGAFAPIGDLTKIEVVELAKYINNEVFKQEVIPEKLIPDKLWRFRSDQIEPSAELKDKQVDPMKFIYHCALVDAFTDYRKKSAENIMQLYLEGRLHEFIDDYLKDTNGNEKIGYELMKRWNITDPNEFIKDLEWFDSQMQKNVFKRIQSPPIIITSKSSFGYDIRESILPYSKLKHCEDLKKKILKLKEYRPLGI
jgi:NAD+ synthase (glutamine-hydrolysing)